MVALSLSRSAVLRAAATALLCPMKPQVASSISATTMTGKMKPELGIILVSPVVAQPNGAISAEVVLSDGLVATTVFNCKWPLAEGGYSDVEAKSRDGDAAFLQISRLPEGQSLTAVSKKWFTQAILSVDGRYGAYGAPTDVKILSDSTDNGTRMLDISFTALSPGSAAVERRAVVSAMQPPGSNDVLMLIGSTSVSRWKKAGGEAAARQAAESLRVVSTRPTNLKQIAQADYRFGRTSGPESMRSRNDGF